jgi:hypothetical protein
VQLRFPDWFSSTGVVSPQISKFRPLHANANFDADARDPSLVPCFSLVSAKAFAVYRMDPHVVVLCPSALGRCVVGLSSKGIGPDLYSCSSGVRLVVLDTPGNCNPGMERIWGFSQQEKDAEKAYLAHFQSTSLEKFTNPVNFSNLRMLVRMHTSARAEWCVGCC